MSIERDVLKKGMTDGHYADTDPADQLAQRTLFIEQYSTEVMLEYRDSLMFANRTRRKQLRGSKSWNFPLLGNVGAQYHAPGTRITAQDVERNTRSIGLDAVYYSAVWVAEIDDIMQYTDERQQYSYLMGQELAEAVDTAIAQEIVKGALSVNDVDGRPGGIVLESDKFMIDDPNPDSAEDGVEQALYLAAGIFALAAEWDERNIPEANRWLVFSPAEYYTLLNNLDLIAKEYNGRGSIAEGTILRIAGFDIIKSTMVPHTDTTASDVFHGVDASKVVGLAFTPESAATVVAKDVTMEVEWNLEYFAWLITARQAMGHGFLRPECCAVFSLDNGVYLSSNSIMEDITITEGSVNALNHQ